MNVWQIVVPVVTGFALGILASTRIVPWISERQQRRLVKSLLKHWGGDCIGAIMRLMPPSMTRMHIEGYTNPGSAHYVMTQLWNDIKEGRKNPEGIATVINQSLTHILYTEEELKSKEPPPEQEIRFFPCDPEVPRAMIKRILNPMYAKLEIFDLELLPINELEIAVSYLEGASQKGYYTRSMYDSYALHLAQSMEKFAKYLWKLEKWSNRPEGQEMESDTANTKRVAKFYLGISIALSAFAIISSGSPQIAQWVVSGFFFVSSIFLFLNRQRPAKFIKFLLDLNVDYLPIFLSLVGATIASYQKNYVILGAILFCVAYGFLTFSIGQSLLTAYRQKRLRK